MELVEKGILLSNRYEILSLLGKGGMSEVWKARHIHLDKIVAVKLLNKELLERKEFMARFKQEAQISSRLAHENICGVSDFGFTEDRVPFIVMECLGGESLADVLKRIDRLPVGAALSIGRQTATGLAAAHKIGVVHRDIKPGNIFIAKEESGNRVVKILDFGISKMVADDKSDLGLTSTGTLMGTSFYLSPEQIMESKGVDRRTDIYALGTVLYKAITGRVPFTGNNFGEVAVKVINDPLVDPRNIVEGLAANVARVIKKAMEKDSRSRYQSAEEMLADLDAVIEDYHDATIDTLYKSRIEDLILKPIEQKPSRYGKKSKVAALGTSFIVLSGAVALTVLFAVNHAGKRAGSGESLAQKPAAGLTTEQTQKKEAAFPELVGIKFAGLPAGARIRVGDEEFTNDLIMMHRSSSKIKVVVMADGYKQREITLMPKTDLEIAASLDPVKAVSETAGEDGGLQKATKPAKPSRIKKMPPSGGGGAVKKKEEYKDFIRDFPG